MYSCQFDLGSIFQMDRKDVFIHTFSEYLFFWNLVSFYDSSSLFCVCYSINFIFWPIHGCCVASQFPNVILLFGFVCLRWLQLCKPLTGCCMSNLMDKSCISTCRALKIDLKMLILTVGLTRTKITGISLCLITLVHDGKSKISKVLGYVYILTQSSPTSIQSVPLLSSSNIHPSIMLLTMTLFYCCDHMKAEFLSSNYLPILTFIPLPLYIIHRIHLYPTRIQTTCHSLLTLLWTYLFLPSNLQFIFTLILIFLYIESMLWHLITNIISQLLPSFPL